MAPSSFRTGSSVDNVIGLQQLHRMVLLCRDYVHDEVRDDEILRAFQSMHVLCVSDARNLSSHGGQTALATVVSLLSRMGMQIGLAIPDVPRILAQPPFPESPIRQSLIATSGKLVVGATVSDALEFVPDVVFLIGDSKFGNGDVPSWRLSGDEWRGTLAAGSTSSARPWTVQWPMGAMISSALAANEAFKVALRRLLLRNKSDQAFLEPCSCCSWGFDPIPIPGRGRLHLGEVDVISAGAICQAALYALSRVPEVEMSGHIYDDDPTSASNLNRNMLSLAADVGEYKVKVASNRCAPNLRLDPVARRFECSRGQTKLAQRVLVGVDHIPSRWAAQRCAPSWLVVSGTSHFSVSSSSHGPGEPCSGCLHPLDEPDQMDVIPTVSFVSFWAGLLMAVRLIRASLGIPYSRDRQHLWLTPLRMDQPNAAMWLRVHPRPDCPVKCLASRGVLWEPEAHPSEGSQMDREGGRIGSGT